MPSQEYMDTGFYSENTNDIKPSRFIFDAGEMVQKYKNVGRIRKDQICKIVMQGCKKFQRRILA